MKRAWKRVAERADKDAFSIEDVSAAIAPILEHDCRAEIDQAFLRDLRSMLDDPNGSLFKLDVKPLVDDLRINASSGMDRAIVANVSAISQQDVMGIDVLLQAVEAAVGDRVACTARQMEEHYLRKASEPRASHLRDRLEEGIAVTKMGEIAARILHPKHSQPREVRSKQSGVDDGVKLP
jgi:hypothetical protein